MQATENTSLVEIVSNLRYILYGFGAALGFIMFLLGLLFKFWTAKIKKIEDDGERTNRICNDVSLIKKDIEVLKSHVEGQNAFTRGLYSISEKLANFKIEQDNLKEAMRDINERCERRHFHSANYDGMERRRRRRDDRHDFEDDIEAEVESRR